MEPLCLVVTFSMLWLMEERVEVEFELGYSKPEVHKIPPGWIMLAIDKVNGCPCCIHVWLRCQLPTRATTAADCVFFPLLQESLVQDRGDASSATSSSRL